MIDQISTFVCQLNAGSKLLEANNSNDFLIDIKGIQKLQSLTDKYDSHLIKGDISWNLIQIQYITQCTVLHTVYHWPTRTDTADGFKNISVGSWKTGMMFKMDFLRWVIIIICFTIQTILGVTLTMFWPLYFLPFSSVCYQIR